MAEDSDSKNATLLATSVFEAAVYERQQLQRRRGIVFLVFAAMFAGLAVLLAVPPSGPTHPIFVYGPLGFVTAGVLYGGYRMQKSPWLPVFQPAVSQRERRWRQAFLFAAVALVSLAGPITMGREAGAPDERLLAGTFAAMMSLLVIASARSMGDAQMQKVATASLVVAPLIWMGIIPAEKAELVVSVALALSLAAVGLHHATRRKQVAR